MGFAAYRLKRTKTSTGEALGEITLIFPKVEKQLILNKAMTLSKLLNSYPDYPIEAHIFIRSRTKLKATNFGFPNIIVVEDYQGETFTLNNGSYFKIGVPDQYGHIPFNTYYSDKSGVQYTSLPDSDNYVLLPSLLGDNSEGPSDGGYVDSYTKATFGEVPSVIHTPLKFFKDAKPLFITDDPYGDGGVSETGGGTGTFSDEGTNIDIPALPAISATDAGFITLFNPTLAELQNLASYMWGDLFDVSGWKKVFADPMNAILGLSLVPVNVPSSSSKPVKVGNISTDVVMTIADSQYVEVDCGTLEVKEFWGAYLDYDPYTKAELYLPYIGTHAIAVDDIMGKSVRIVYHVDILSGACCAYIQCDGTVLYSFIGQCTSSIPITGDNWTNVINGALSIASSVGTMVATGGASAPMSIGQIASTAVNTMKPSIEKSGAMGGTGGLMGVQTPYLIITRPRQALPGDQNQFIGYPSFITKKLSALSGYTEVESIHLENVPATEPELVEIENLLNGGVIF